MLALSAADPSAAPEAFLRVSFDASTVDPEAMTAEVQLCVVAGLRDSCASQQLPSPNPPPPPARSPAPPPPVAKPPLRKCTWTQCLA